MNTLPAHFTNNVCTYHNVSKRDKDVKTENNGGDIDMHR